MHCSCAIEPALLLPNFIDEETGSYGSETRFSRQTSNPGQCGSDSTHWITGLCCLVPVGG